MATNNINTLQKLPFTGTDKDLQSKATDEYLKQSLSNLGQRFSVKGDSTVRGSFTIYELFGGTVPEPPAAGAAAYIEGAVADNLTASLTAHWGTEQKTIQLPDNYSEETDIYITGTKPKSAATGKEISYLSGLVAVSGASYPVVVQTYDSTHTQLGVTVDMYDNDTKRVAEGVHIYQYDGVTYITEIYYNGVGYNVIHSTTGIAPDTIYSTILADVDKRSWTPSEAIAGVTKTEIGRCTAEYDKSTQTIDVSADIESLSDDTAQQALVKANMVEWDGSLALAFPAVKERFWQKDKRAFLVAELLRALHANDGSTTVYMPYSYSFVYACSSADTTEILYSESSVTVESVAEPDLYKITGEGMQQVLLSKAAATDDDVFSEWKYWCGYGDDGYLTSVNLYSYTPAYINSDGYWVINGVPTAVRATGKDAGQPLVIMTYSNTAAGEYGVLSSFKRDEVLALGYEEVEFNLQSLDEFDNRIHVMKAYMPKNISGDDTDTINLLETAVIMSVSSVQGTTLAEQLGDSAAVTTFWTLKEDAGEYSFECVKQYGTDYALDVNHIAGISEITQYYMLSNMEPDKYEHSWVVYDTVKHLLKNEYGDSNVSYPVVMNRPANSFNSTFFIGYRNNANFVVSFVSTVYKENGFIKNVVIENEKKYFRFDSDGGDPVAYTVPTVQAYKADGDYADEWYPDAREMNTSGWADTLLPVVDLKEVLLRNTNTLNRSNVLSTDAAGKMYYAYYGTSYENADKGIVHLGTGTTDINLGTDTLTTETERSKFNRHHELDIDFDNIVTNGDLLATHGIWSKSCINGACIYNTNYELSYTGVFPETVTDISKAVNFPYFRCEETVSDAITDIGGGTNVAGKTSYVSYLNVTWLAKDVLNVHGFDMYSSVYGGDSLCWTTDETTAKTTYFLRLSTDIADASELLTDYSNGVYSVKMNPVSLSYMDIDGSCRLNVRETLSQNSSVYAVHDGGELG